MSSLRLIRNGKWRKRSQSGATLVEYSVLCSLLCLVSITALVFLGTQISQVFLSQTDNSFLVEELWPTAPAGYSPEVGAEGERRPEGGVPDVSCSGGCERPHDPLQAGGTVGSQYTGNDHIPGKDPYYGGGTIGSQSPEGQISG